MFSLRLIIRLAITPCESYSHSLRAVDTLMCLPGWLPANLNAKIVQLVSALAL